MSLPRKLADYPGNLQQPSKSVKLQVPCRTSVSTRPWHISGSSRTWRCPKASTTATPAGEVLGWLPGFGRRGIPGLEIASRRPGLPFADLGCSVRLLIGTELRSLAPLVLVRPRCPPRPDSPQTGTLCLPFLGGRGGADLYPFPGGLVQCVAWVVDVPLRPCPSDLPTVFASAVVPYRHGVLIPGLWVFVAGRVRLYQPLAGGRHFLCRGNFGGLVLDARQRPPGRIGLNQLPGLVTGMAASSGGSSPSL